MCVTKHEPRCLSLWLVSPYISPLTDPSCLRRLNNTHCKNLTPLRQGDTMLTPHRVDAIRWRSNDSNNGIDDDDSCNDDNANNGTVDGSAHASEDDDERGQ